MAPKSHHSQYRSAGALVKKPPKYEEAIPLRLCRNPSYWQSVKLGFLAAVWFMPLTFVRAIRYPVATLIIASFQLALQLLVWAVSRILILAAALCGMMSEIEKDDGSREAKSAKDSAA